MYSVLYTNGCSMTEGSELGNKKFNYDEAKHGPNTTRGLPHMSQEHQEYMMANNYSYILKEMLGIPTLVNDGQGGSSNSRIVRTTILGVNKLLEQYKPEEIFVVIGWSTIDRFEYYHKGHYAQVVPGWPPGPPFPKDFIKLCEAHSVWISTNLEHCMQNHYLEIIHLKNFLKLNKVKFLFTYGLSNDLASSFGGEPFGEMARCKPVRTLFKHVYNENWFFGPKFDHKYLISFETAIKHFGGLAFFTNTTHRGFAVGAGGHPLEEAHIDWAKHLHKFITSQENK